MIQVSEAQKAKQEAFQLLLKDYEENKKPCKNEEDKMVYVLTKEELKAIITETAFACALSPTFFNDLTSQD